MRIVIRNNLTNEEIVELFDGIEEGLTENDINEMLQTSPGMDEEIEELLANEDYHISYEE